MTANALPGDERHQRSVRNGAALVLRRLPSWRPERHSNDFGYWVAGSELARAQGGRTLVVWRKALTETLVESQRKDRPARGSWDPTGAWCYCGGRVYATAMGLWALQAIEGRAAIGK